MYLDIWWNCDEYNEVGQKELRASRRRIDEADLGWLQWAVMHQHK